MIVALPFLLLAACHLLSRSISLSAKQNRHTTSPPLLLLRCIARRLLLFSCLTPLFFTPPVPPDPNLAAPLVQRCVWRLLPTLSSPCLSVATPLLFIFTTALTHHHHHTTSVFAPAARVRCVCVSTGQLFVALLSKHGKRQHQALGPAQFKKRESEQQTVPSSAPSLTVLCTSSQPSSPPLPGCNRAVESDA